MYHGKASQCLIITYKAHVNQERYVSSSNAANTFVFSNKKQFRYFSENIS